MKPFIAPLLFICVACNDQIRTREIAGEFNMKETTPPVADVSPSPPSPPVVFETSLVHSRCQSPTRCLYARMPVYRQDSAELENYVGMKLKIANYSDPGLCVPTAGAMLLKAVIDEKDSQTVLNNPFLSSLSSKAWYEIVYQLGVDAGTDFIYGGTDIQYLDNKFSDYFSKTSTKKGLKYYRDGMNSKRAYISNENLIQEIRSKKLGFVIGVDFSTKQVSDGITWYRKDEGGHAMVVKGYDGDRIHLQDPWGMDYFVRIESEVLSHDPSGIKEKNSVFKYAGYQGFMGRYNSSHKFSLDEIYGISLD